MHKQLLYKYLLLFLCGWISVGTGRPADVKNSLFADGRWVKVETAASGIHQLPFSWLKAAGFAHPDRVRIFGSRNEAVSPVGVNIPGNRPVQLPALRFQDGDGNASLLFFVPGPVTWKYDPATRQYFHSLNQAARGKSIFFLTEDAGSDLPFPVKIPPSRQADVVTTAFDDFWLWEEENINLLESGSRWFFAQLPGGKTLKKELNFPDRQENEPVQLTVAAAGRSISPTGMEVAIGETVWGNLSFVPVGTGLTDDFASLDSLATSRVIPGSNLTLSLRYNGNLTNQCWLDFATLQFRRNLQYRGSPLLFRESRSLDPGKLVEYRVAGSKPGLQLWEVTRPAAPTATAYQLNNGTLTFRAPSDTLRTFVLFDPAASYPTPSQTETVKNAEIFPAEAPQYLIVAPEAFLAQAVRLADYHRQADGMRVTVVPVEAVFNEFTGGYPDATALRNYIHYLYQQGSGQNGSVLKYLLLLGKGTYDQVHGPGENNPNWIPTYQSENSLSPVNSYVTDDFFGWMDPGYGNLPGNIPLGIGRIPAATPAEAAVAVDKIIHYHDAPTLGDWRNNLAFIGDDGDGNLHVSASETLAALVNGRNPEYHTQKIYLDAYPQALTPEKRYPEAKEAIRRSIQAGDLMVNYIGHANEDGLAQERVLTAADVDLLTNKERLPLFVTATCEFSRWDMTVKRSVGERLLFHSGGGAIALLSATRLVYSAANFDLNKSFLLHAFDRDSQEEPLCLGDLIRMVKNENGSTVNALKFCLLGDPALRLNYPEYRCRTLEINGRPVDPAGVTLSPMQLVTVTGQIENPHGEKRSFFNGNLSVRVYDQPAVKQTLGNGGIPPFSYQVQENVLFSGQVPVKNGTFSYSFVVPKDVSLNSGSGLIHYYGSNATVDAAGSLVNLRFNGNETLPVSDQSGPAITLYLDNEAFRPGGAVSPNPLLMVYLKDESGINTSGYGLGHDITLELDGDVGNRIVLTNLYQSDPGNWKSGSILYPLSDLPAGQHTLRLKVWDTANNASELVVSFVVQDKLLLSNIRNFPNPFSGPTRFVVTHNRYGASFDAGLDIFDLTGRKIFSDRQLLLSNGYEVDGLVWDPLQTKPVPPGGVYLYRITLTDHTGSRIAGSGRLIWKK